jgi:hypothetical protein
MDETREEQVEQQAGLAERRFPEAGYIAAASPNLCMR